MDDIRTFGSAEASGRVETIDWDREIRRKRAPEGSGAPVGAGASDRSTFRTTLGTLGRGFLDGFGSFGGAEASGSVGTTAWDRGTCRKRPSDGFVAPVGAGASESSIFWTTLDTLRRIFWTLLGHLAVLKHPEV